MSIKRTEEYKGIPYMFDDAYGETENKRTAQRLIAMAAKTSFEKLFVPFPPNATPTLTKEDMIAAEADDGVLYVLPIGTNFSDGFELPTIYTDETYETALGGIYGDSVVFMCLPPIVENNGAIKEIIDRKAEACLDSEIEPKRRAYEHAQVAAFISSRIGARRKTAEQNLSQYRASYKTNAEAMFMYAGKIEEAEALIRGTSDDPQEKKRIEDDIEELFGSTVLKRVEFKGTTVIFHTGELSITDAGGNVRPIGAFEATIDLPSSSVKFNNTNNHIDPKYGRIPHPHCSSEGSPCLGNIGSVVPALCHDYDVLGLWQIVLSFLTSYNGDDSWGRQLIQWPAVDKNGNKIAAPSISAQGAAVRCHHCGDTIEEGEEQICDRCGHTVCSECATTFVREDLTEYTLCEDCTEYCDICGTQHDPEVKEMHQCAQCVDVRFCKYALGIINKYDMWFCSLDCLNEYERDNDLPVTEAGDLA